MTSSESLRDAAHPRAVAPPGAWRAEAALAVVLVTWASAFVGVRAVAPHLQPGSIALGRLLVALPVLTLVGWWSRSTAPAPPIVPAPPITRLRDRRGMLMVAVYGVFWFAGYNLALNAASARIDAGTVALLVNTGPLIVAVVAGLVLGEGFPPRLVAGLAIGFAGVGVIALGRGAEGGPLGGVALALVAATLYATGVLTQKVALRTVDPATATRAGAAVGALVLLPYLPGLIGEVRSAPTGALVWLCYLGAGPTATGFLLWAYVLRHAAAGRTASATLAIPALTVAISWLVLGELPTVLSVLGGTVALAGVAVSRSRPGTTGTGPAPIRVDRAWQDTTSSTD